MKALLVAIGNPLRGDDAVAEATLQLIPPSPGLETLSLAQLTPELSAQISTYDVVVFLDADLLARKVTLAPVESTPPPPSLTHVSTPEEILALARSLYAFPGQALACRLPISSLAPGEPLTPQARLSATRAAQLLRQLLRQRIRPAPAAPHPTFFATTRNRR
jgi:hydrogenase maturation protease